MKITKKCIRCKCMFQYGDMDKSLCGQMTRRYCNVCKILQHKDEARIYSLKYSRDNRESLNTKARIKYRVQNELQKM
jgi:hypothetical protein